jgi:perosamine synthetase
VAQLESALKKKVGIAHAVCVASGSAALRLTLKGLGVQPGDTVLVPAYCCVALVNAVLACHATPVTVDVRESDWNLDPGLVKDEIDRRQAKAIIAVNTFGAPAAVSEMQAGGVPVVEDCAHAFGVAVNGVALGKRGSAAVLSFYATKLIGAGEGGAVLCDSPALAGFIAERRDYTDRAPGADRFNDKMTDLEAALGLCQLVRLDDMLEKRRIRSQRYEERLGGLACNERSYRLPETRSERVWYRYAVEMLDRPASSVVSELRRYGINAEAPIDDWRPADARACPVADRAYRGLVSLPLYPTLTDEEQDRVIQAFLSICRGNPKET